MGLFKNDHFSHEHSLEILNLLYGYDSFLDSLSVVADMGCGAGLDTEWWAKLETRDDPPEPRDYTVYAVDKDIRQIHPYILSECKNVIPLAEDFDTVTLPKKADLIWAHDSFHLSLNPLVCLKNWKANININGMLVMAIPQTTYMQNNRLTTIGHNYQFYNYNILNLMYMLAMNGFDCHDAYFYRKAESPWLYAAVYATENDPFDGYPSWYDLADRNLINSSLVESVGKYGYVKLEETIVAWLDKDFYQITN